MQDLLQVSTDLVEPKYRTDYWRDVTRPLFDCLPCEEMPSPSLEGKSVTRIVETLMTCHAKFRAQRFIRDWKIISRSGLEDYYLLQLLTGGNAVTDCGGSNIKIPDGSVYLFDLGRTFSSKCSHGSTYTLLLRREAVEKALNGRKLHGLLFKAGLPQTRLLADVIMGIMRLTQTGIDVNPSATEDAVISLLALALCHHAAPSEPDDLALIPILRSRVLDFIDTNLAEPTLDIQMIMNRFRVSRAHLYRMFATEGGVMRTICERRLIAAFRQLVKTPATDTPQLAKHFGFSDPDQFQRLFQRRFVMTLHEVKHERANVIVKSQCLSNMQSYLARYTTPKSAATC